MFPKYVRKLAWHVCFVDTHGSTGCLRITTLESIGGETKPPLPPVLLLCGVRTGILMVLSAG